MAETSEGFSINVNIIVDNYDDIATLGEIRLSPVVVITDSSAEYSTSIILDKDNSSDFIGDIKRANNGNEGFTIKSDCYLDRPKIEEVLGDIKHGKVIISQAAADILSSIVLDDTDTDLFVADFLRSNSGSQGFTLKAGIELDSSDIDFIIADIIHGKIITSEDDRDILASLCLDKTDNKCIGDFLRSNKGHGLLVKGYLNLNDYEREKIVGDLYRSNKTKSTYNTIVFIWNGEKYFVIADERLFEGQN